MNNIDKLTPQLLGKVLGEDVSYIDMGMPNDDSDDVLYEAEGHQTTINIYELMFRIRDYYKTQGIHVSLNASIEEILEAVSWIEEQGEKQ